MMTIVLFIIILGMLVLVHECGHFFVARRNGIRVDEFGLGLPPRMVGIQKQNGIYRLVWGRRGALDKASEQGTIYSINWLPLGGFVRIHGEDGSHSDEKDSFSAKSIGKRIAVLVSGVGMNVIAAVVLFSAMFMVGTRSLVTEDQIARAGVSNVWVQVVEVLPESPADKAGIKPGDRIGRIDGNEVYSIETVRSYMARHEGQSVAVLVETLGEEGKTVMVAPEKIAGNDAAVMGVGLVTTAVVKYPLPFAMVQAAKETATAAGLIFFAVGSWVSSLWQDTPPVVDVAGPVGIALMTGDAVRMGLASVLQFAGILSINLAVINILPFPALDGGRALFLVIEKIRGKAVNRRIETALHNVGFIFLIGLIVVVTVRDIWMNFFANG